MHAKSNKPPSRAPSRPPSRGRQLNVPRPTRVRAGAGGAPVTVDGRVIDAVRESWLVEDRWWTERPLRRRYWEVITDGGADLVVFHDLRGGRWFAQR